MTSTDFAYGYGRVGVLQQQLLSKPDVDRMVGAHNDKELRHVLSDIALTARVMPQDDLSRVVPSLELWLKDEVRRMSPPESRDTFDIIWLREDVPVIALLLKQYLGFAPKTDDAGMGITAYDHDALRKLVWEGERGSLPEDLAHFVEELKHESGIKPQDIDHKVAVFVAEKQMELAKASGSKLIKQYVAHLIDLQNIRTSRRLTPGEDGTDHFLPGGEIDTMRLTGDPRSLALLIHSSSLPNVLADSVMNEKNSALALERALNLALAHDIAAMRAIPLGIEAIFAFAVMALSQTLMLRTILIGKAAQLTGGEISQMLPPIFSTSVENA